MEIVDLPSKNVAIFNSCFDITKGYIPSNPMKKLPFSNGFQWFSNGFSIKIQKRTPSKSHSTTISNGFPMVLSTGAPQGLSSLCRFCARRWSFKALRLSQSMQPSSRRSLAPKGEPPRHQRPAALRRNGGVGSEEPWKHGGNHRKTIVRCQENAAKIVTYTFRNISFGGTYIPVPWRTSQNRGWGQKQGICPHEIASVFQHCISTFQYELACLKSV